MAETKEKLFSEFPPVSVQQWTDKVVADLKGAPFDKKMIWKTGEGFDVNPFYTAEDTDQIPSATALPGEFPYMRGTSTKNEWLVRQDFKVSDADRTNAEALDVLNGKGVASLGFCLDDEVVNTKGIATLLNGISAEEIELNFCVCNRRAVELIGLLSEYYKAKGFDLNKCKGSVRYDAFKKPLMKGVPLKDSWVADAVAVVKAGETLSGYRVLSVDACWLSDAGALITQELGYALSWGNELIAKLSEAGLSVEDVAKNIKFNFGVSSNYFMEIAKFRAARWLWAKIVKAYSPSCDDVCKMHAHARTTSWNLTIYDAYVNLLRTQTETMSAALAGVDSIAVLPYDYAFKQPDEFSERIARNQQLILKEECHFDKVTDPAAGSYYIEALTQSIAEAAWQLFLTVEDNGGFATAASSGEVQTAVNQSNKSRRTQIATRRIVLLGSNQYPNFTEKVAGGISSDKDTDCCSCPAEKAIPTLDMSRGAAEFEALRLETEKSGKTPKAFMLTIGNLAMRLARSQFSCNFFACAGYEVIDNLGFETVAAGVEAARAKGADLIVLCSSDDEYATFAPEAYELVKDKEIFVVAGAPACTDDLKAQGITNFINVKSNVLETLKSFNELLIK
ncbi:MAG: methylmalonyl-CoA mutase small subunit [Tannerella sp.]|nr:methylmalonyl-CoA mutase small subunit [Tannerella sp.]